MTVGLAVNATGTHILKPLIVKKLKKPRCHKIFQASDISYYYNNQNAWVVTNIFQDYLNQISKLFKTKICLIMDNCTSHRAITLRVPSNIEIGFCRPVQHQYFNH